MHFLLPKAFALYQGRSSNRHRRELDPVMQTLANAIEHSRQKRNPIAAYLSANAGKILAQTLVWSTASTVGGIATGVAGAVVNAHYEDEQISRTLRRRKIECLHNNRGCVKIQGVRWGICWTNCGPRVYSSDWCFTESKYKMNATTTTTTTTETPANITTTGTPTPTPTPKPEVESLPEPNYAKCFKDSDCDPCAECAIPCSSAVV